MQEIPYGAWLFCALRQQKKTNVTQYRLISFTYQSSGKSVILPDANFIRLIALGAKNHEFERVC